MCASQKVRTLLKMMMKKVASWNNLALNGRSDLTPRILNLPILDCQCGSQCRARQLTLMSSLLFPSIWSSLSDFDSVKDP